MRQVTLRLALFTLLALPLCAAAQQLTVSAAASLTDAFREIGVKFEALKPGATVRFNFAGSAWKRFGSVDSQQTTALRTRCLTP